MRNCSESRDIIRNSWGKTNLPSGEVKLVFVMGNPGVEDIKQEVCMNLSEVYIILKTGFR